jgi:microcystin-dependent protein
MDYTQSGNKAIDALTGHAYHDDGAPFPTIWGAKDANSLIWSLMEVVLASGLTPKQFDRADPSTYKVFKAALDALYAKASSGLQVGDIKYSTSVYAPTDFISPAGVLLTRSAYPELWGYAQASGNLVSDATWAAGAFGSYSTGDGSTTFRSPNYLGYFIRALNQTASGVDASRTIGVVQADAFKAHSHDFYASETSDYSYTGPDDEKNSGYRQQTYATSTVGGTETRPVNIALPIWLRYR